MTIQDDWFRHNAEVRGEAEKLASKTRKRNFILDDYQLHAFYEQRIPDEVYDLASLRRTLKKDRQLKSQLMMSIDDLIESESLDVDEFPSALDVGTTKLPLSYHFEPGSQEDGVTVTVPASAVSQLHPGQLEWLVPGLLEEKLIALIRSLPKRIRRGLVPAPDTAATVAKELTFSDGDFLQTVATRFSQIADERITPDDFRLEKLPAHLRMRIHVIDDEGRTSTSGRSVDEVKSTLVATGAQAESLDEQVVDSAWHRDQLTTWDFGELPQEVKVRRGGIEVAMYPAIVEFEDHSVGLRLEESKNFAAAATRHGLRRLFQQLHKKSLRSQVRWLPRWDEICLWSAALYDKATLEDQLSLLLADVAFLTPQLPLTQAAFDRLQDERGERITQATQQVANFIPQLMEAFHQARLAREQMPTSRFQRTQSDVDMQLMNLLHGSFLSDTPIRWLQHFPRYLSAVELRLQKLSTSGEAIEVIDSLTEYWQRVENCDEMAIHVDRDAVVEFRWMLEEYRVSIFAQQLGTAVKVSPQRLEKQWQKTRR